MKRFITYEPYTEDVGSVTGIFVGAVPVEITGGSNVIETRSPDPAVFNFPNLTPVLRINLSSNELYYDYESNQTLEMRLTFLSTDFNELKTDKNTLSSEVSSLNTDITDTQVAVTESYETTLKVEEDTTKTQLALTEVYEELLKTQAALSTVNLAIQTLQAEIAKLKGE